MEKAWDFAVDSNDSATFYISKLKAISEQEKNKLLQVKTLEIEGLYYEIAKSNYTKATELYLTEIKIAEENKLAYLKNLYHTFGVMFHTTDEYDKAEIYYQKSLEAAKKTADKDLLVRCLINLGSVNSTKENYIKAEKLFLESLQYAAPFETKRSTYSNLGNMKIREGKFKEAIYYLEKSVQINPETGLDGDIMDYYFLIDAKSKLKNQTELQLNQEQFEKQIFFYLVKRIGFTSSKKINNCSR